MSTESTKYYVAQYGCAIFGIGDSEETALQNARNNGLNFNGSDVNHVSGSMLLYMNETLEGNELVQGMIICMGNYTD